MNNEPVAYGMLSFCKNYGKQNPYPVKELKLTKSEIEVLWEKHCPFDLTGGLAFARAILRKAQEK